MKAGGGDETVGGIVEDVFCSPWDSAVMSRVAEVRAVAGAGLDGDRYALRAGHWTGRDECEVTLVEGEALDAVARDAGLATADGEHRRNIVTRGLRLDALAGARFRVGGALLAYDRPRPPCRHVEELSQRGMRRALTGRGGICARVVESGVVAVGAPIVVEAFPDGAGGGRGHGSRSSV